MLQSRLTTRGQATLGVGVGAGAGGAAIAMTPAATTKPTAARATFTITLRAEPGVNDAIRALRIALKGLLRRHGLRAIGIEEHKGDEDARPNPE